MHFLSSVREALNKELTEQQVKDMMKLYISGTSVEEALREVING